MIFKSFTLTFLVLLISYLPATLSYEFQYEKDTNIMILSQIDFPQAIQQYPYLLVNFYARWCKYSKKLAPEYLKLSQTLKKDNSEVKIAKVEAYDEKALAQEFDIEGFPTIKMFISGVPHEYYGDKTESHILEFINRKLKKPLSTVSNIKSLENFLKEYEWIAVLIGEDNNPGVLEAASKLQDVLFVSTTSDAIKKKYGDLTNGEFFLLNNVTKGYKVGIEELNTENILSFIKNNRFSATIPRFGRGTAEHIMSSEEPAMILIKDNSQASKTAEEAFTTASQDLNGKIFMTIADYQEEIGQLLAKSLGVKQEELPAVIFLCM